MRKISGLRWWIAILLGVLIALNYIDRQSFPVAVLEITKQIPVSDRDYGRLQAIFLVTYALMYAGGGKLLDVLGTRLGYALMIFWWSAATIGQGLVQGIFGMAIARAMLGLGEGGGFPGAAKSVSEWFPPQERSLAFGIFTFGSSIGPSIAVPLVTGIILLLNWRWVFFITGGLGFIWLIGWWLLYNSPAKHKRITPQEQQYILKSLSSSQNTAAAPPAQRIRWTSLFAHRQLWGIVLPKFLTDAGWFFLIFWLPKYLGDVRHLDIAKIGYLAWIPYAVSGVGCLVGGWLSGALIRKGLSLNRSRKITLAIGAAIVPIAAFTSRVPLPMVIVVFSLALFGHQFWSTILQTLAADIFPSSAVGSVAGLMGSAGSAGAAAFNLIAGILLSRFAAYPILFTIVAVLYPASWLIVWLLIRRIEPLPVASQGAEFLGMNA
jgi:MFS transporter, ACS family, hexuronate transporter